MTQKKLASTELSIILMTFTSDFAVKGKTCSRISKLVSSDFSCFFLNKGSELAKKSALPITKHAYMDNRTHFYLYIFLETTFFDVSI